MRDQRPFWLISLYLITCSGLFAEPKAPAIEPPQESFSVFDPPAPPQQTSLAQPLTPSVEWTLHKTADSAHPDGNEQAMVWLMNQARQIPTAEGIWLATSNESDIASGRNFFNVNTTLLQTEFASYAAKPPAAFDVRLYLAAKAHSMDLIVRDAQDHDGQFARVSEQGFSYTQARGNVFSYARNPLYAHAAFNIDWGNAPDGMQSSRGHRKAIMSIDGNYTNFGLAAVSDTDTTTNVGPLVMTGNFAKASSFATDHYNRFIVGTVWEDLNNNERYDPGEGFSGVTVMPNNGLYYAITSNGGGYSIPITSAGTYQMTFSGGAITADYTTGVDIGSDSILLDYLVGHIDPTCSGTELLIDLISYPDNSSTICSGSISITTQNTVVIESGAHVTYLSPKIILNPRFSVKHGGTFQAGV